MHLKNLFRLLSIPVVFAAVVCLLNAWDSFAAEKGGSKLEKISKTSPAKRDTTVAIVNGSLIDEKELDRARKYMLRGETVPADKKGAIDRQIVEQLVMAELLYQAAVKEKSGDIDAAVDTKIAIDRRNFNSDQEFKDALKNVDMDEKSYRDNVRRGILIAGFVEQTFAAKAVVTEEEKRAFYDKNIDKFKQEESVRASHILIGIDAKATDDEKKKALEKAEGLRKEIVAGADFAALARINSTDPGSGPSGGDLGFFGKGQMVPPFEKAAFALTPGGISEVVESQFGYHIIRLTAKRGAGTADFAEVSPNIERYLKGQKSDEALQKYLAGARQGAKIEIRIK